MKNIFFIILIITGLFLTGCGKKTEYKDFIEPACKIVETQEKLMNYINCNASDYDIQSAVSDFDYYCQEGAKIYVAKTAGRPKPEEKAVRALLKDIEETFIDNLHKWQGASDYKSIAEDTEKAVSKEKKLLEKYKKEAEASDK